MDGKDSQTNAEQGQLGEGPRRPGRSVRYPGASLRRLHVRVFSFGSLLGKMLTPAIDVNLPVNSRSSNHRLNYASFGFFYRNWFRIWDTLASGVSLASAESSDPGLLWLLKSFSQAYR
nr:hypothetical protein L203_01385 [Cryptococcus depauperatus CBS 7841]